MIIITFALPDESRSVVARLRNPIVSGSRALPIISGTYGAREIVVCHTGVGALSAREQLQGFWEKHGGPHVDGVMSSGFAGGLDPALPAGALILAANYPERLEACRRILGERVRIGFLATASDVLETPQAKAEYACQTGAAAVDMESAIIADFFREKGVRVPFLALRGISDAVCDALPVASSVWFDASTQSPRPLALICFLLRHPGRFRPFLRFVKTIFRTRRLLASALLELLPAM